MEENTAKEIAGVISIEAGGESYQENGIIIASLRQATDLASSILLKNSLSFYPNPATTHTHIRFSLIENAQVEVQLFNMQGQLMQQLCTNTSR